MLDEGSLDRCGVTLLAGKAVGAPFVGTLAATLVLAEVLRLLHGGLNQDQDEKRQPYRIMIAPNPHQREPVLAAKRQSPDWLSPSG